MMIYPLTRSIKNALKGGDDNMKNLKDIEKETDLRKKIETIDEILQKDPRNEESLYKKGTELYHLGEFEEAVKCFNQILAGNPNIRTILARGVAYKAMKRYDSAMKDFTYVVQNSRRYIVDKSSENYLTEVAKDHIADTLTLKTYS